MLGITILGVAFIATVIGIMLLLSFSGHDTRVVQLPEAPAAAEKPGSPEPDALNRIEATKDTIQAIVSTLSRPDTYQRSVTIDTFWGGGHAVYNIIVTVIGEAASLRVTPSVGPEKRIIITRDKLYIWYSGDRTPYEGVIDSNGDWRRMSDEWQMLVSYEDLLRIDKNDIINAGYIEYNDDYCLYADCRVPLLGYTRRYYIPISLGLVTGAEDHDENGNVVYNMTSGECIAGEADVSAFLLPDGTNVLQL